MGYMNTAPIPAAPAEEPRWLTADEQRVWRSYIEAATLLEDHLDRQLQRDAGMPHVYYGLLVKLAESPRRRLRMTELARYAKITRLPPLTRSPAWRRTAGCAARTAPPTSGASLAILTDEGYEVLSGTAPGHVEAVRQAVFDRLTPEQQKSLGEIMRIVAEGLQPSEQGADLPWLR